MTQRVEAYLSSLKMITRNPSEKETFIPLAVDTASLTSGLPMSITTAATGEPGLLNCVLDTVKTAAGETIRMVRSRPPIDLEFELASSTIIRGMFYDENTNALWWVIGTTVYKDSSSVNTLTSSTGAVFFLQFRYGAANNILVMETGTAKFTTLNPSTGATVASASPGFTSYAPPVVLDGYVFAVGADSQRIYNSTLSTPTVFDTSNDYIDAEMDGDTLIYIAKYKNHLVAFGNSSMEFFYNAAAEIGSPLRRQVSYARQLGILNNIFYSKNTFTYTERGVAWIGGGESNSFGIYILNNFVPVKISSPFIEDVLQKAIAEDNNTNTYDVGLMTVGYKGRDLILLNTYNYEYAQTVNYVYDLDEQAWYEWAFYDNATRLAVTGVVSARNANYYATRKGTNYDIHRQHKVFSSSFNSNTYEDPLYHRIRTDVLTFGTGNYKQINYVDLVGDLQSGQSVELQYASRMDSGTVITHDSKIANASGLGETIRWRQLGRHKQLYMTLVVTGDGDFALRGININYTEGRK